MFARTSKQVLRCLPWLLLAAGLGARPGMAQEDDFDPAWYNPNQGYVKVGVVEDGMYRITGQALLDAGVPLATINPATFKLLLNGREVPLDVAAGQGGVLTAADALSFFGRRNDGSGEAWAYDHQPGYQGSTFNSLYTDTTFYWLTWNGAAGRRYASPPEPTPAAPREVSSLPDTLHLENDVLYFHGEGSVVGTPLYTRDEGFYWASLRLAGTTNQVNRTFDANLSAPTRSPTDSVTFRARLKGETNVFHRAFLELRLLEDALDFVPFDTLDWTGYEAPTLGVTVAQDKIPAGGLVKVRVNALQNPLNDTPNYILLDWIEAIYPRELRAVDGRLKFAVAEPDDYRFTLSGFTGASVRVYDPAAASVYTLTSAGDTFAFTDTPGAPKTYLAVQDDGYLAPVALTLDAPSNLANTGNTADYVILTTPFLRPSAEAQADYRASADGGGYDVMVVEVQDVFDQFDYGRATPLAVRRFVRNLQDWATAPRFLVIWGDALFPDRRRARRPWEVLSFGNASSDGWYAMQNDGPADWSESIAIGRVTMRDNDQGMTYVQKVQSYEATPLDRWQKRAAFLVGGTSQGEKTVLQNLTLAWSDLASTAPSGLDTLHFFKNSEVPLDPTFKDSLSTAFHEGVSWLNYFGHSASQTWEIVTEPPENFDNALRLPIAVSLGCFTGTFASGTGDETDTFSFGEQLVSASLNGSIAHFGATDKGTIGASAEMGDELHQSVFADTVRILGLAMQQAKRRYNAKNNDPQSIKHLLQYGLLGDPALRISLPTRPDFRVRDAQISVSPIAPVPSDSNMVLTVQVQNLGLVAQDSVDVHLLHVLPGGQSVQYSRRLPPFPLVEAVAFTISITDQTVGENRFTVTVDPSDAIAEEDEFNNQALQTQIVFSSALTLNTPFQFGLEDSVTPTLRVSIATTASAGLDVLFQLDTTPGFDSPALVEQRVAQEGFVTAWQPGTLQDGATYYWRARLDDPDQPANWQAGAFTVRTDLAPYRWLQQGSLFQANEQSTFLERTDAAWAFKTYTLNVQVNAVRPGGIINGAFSINGQQMEQLGLGFGVLVIDGSNGDLKAVGSMPTYPNNFEDPADAFAELKAVTAAAEQGDYVFVRTRNFGNKDGVSEIPDSVKAVFRAFGSTAIDTLTYQDLWIMKTRVGFPQSLEEWTRPPGSGVAENEMIQTFEIPFFFSEGTTVSPPIGPAQAWASLRWEQTLSNSESDIQVEVLSPGGAVLRGPFGTPAEVDLSGIDPLQYPYLRLRATLADASQRSTPQLDAWYVGYEPVAELALDPYTLRLTPDTLQEGTPLEVEARVQSLNGAAAPVAVLDYLLTNAANERTLVRTDTLYDVTTDATAHLTLETFGLVGQNQLLLTVRQPDRQEATTFDNAIILPFLVRRDATPPTFEVLIDGEAFPNDPNPVVNLQDPALPFVAYNPTVEITVRDDNTFLALQDDTTLVTVTLDDRAIPFSILSAGKGRDDNELFLRFQPDFSGPDTTHTLVVTAEDATGNQAVGSPYQVHFRTQSELAVESIYPYPNPMSTSTVFAFRLRGRDALMVEEFRLRIYTVTGRLVREFDLVEDVTNLEAGTLRIGWNKLRWDGRDEDGDPVATGVYLYRVFARAEGEDLDLGTTSRIEKVVVLR